MTQNNDNLAQDVLIDDRIVHIRPIENDDLENERRLVKQFSRESRYARFVRGDNTGNDQAARAPSEMDFSKEMAFIAVLKNAEGEEQEIGVSRYANDEFDHCESAVIVTDEWLNKGLAKALMKALIDFARHQGHRYIYTVDSIENSNIRKTAYELGMTGQRDPSDASLIRYELTI